MVEKRCTRCRRYKPLRKFEPNRGRCYSCRYQQKHPERACPFHDRVRAGVIERKCRKAFACGGGWAAITEFVPNPNVKHGRLYTCLICQAAYRRAYRAARKAAA